MVSSYRFGLQILRKNCSSSVATYQEFTETDWQRIERDWNAWWAGELERPLVVIEMIDPGVEPDVTRDQLTRFHLDMPVAQVLDFVQKRLDATHFFGDAFPKWWVNFGPGIMAGFLGARVEHQTGTTWFHHLGVESLAAIQPAYDSDNAWWQRVLAVTHGALDRWGDKIAVGLTDIGGNLDILASLRGTENLLMDVIDAPDEVDRLTRAMTDLWLRYFDELDTITRPAGRGIANWGPCWAPGRGYMLQCDFSYMISPDMCERFVLPDLTACCNAMDYAFYHMDGKGQIRHLEHLLSIENLRGIQWQPGAGQPLADSWLDLLRRIRDGGKLCQVYVTPEGALTITRELGGKGFLFYIVSDDSDEPTLTPEQINTQLEDFLSALHKEH